MSSQAYGALPGRERSFIVLVALLQGLALYLVDYGQRHTWWLSEPGPQVYWYTLVLAVPTLMTLSVQRLDDRRFWQHAAGVAAVYALLAAWAAWSVTGAPGINPRPVLLPFAITVAGGLFIALPFLQCRLEHGRWHAPYPELFDHAWQNGLTLVVAALFTAVCWLVLTLWAALFELVHIRVFGDLFERRPFVYLASGLFAGLGILVGRTQQHPLRTARQLVFAVCRGLLPLLALVAVMFIASLPFTGLAPLWATRSAAGLLLGLLLLLVAFVNAVWQDGVGIKPYPRALRLLIDVALVLSPLFALLAGYALALRIGQYGWTAARFWAVVVALVLACHAVGYAMAALWRRDAWLASLPRVNVVVAGVVVLLVVLANSPLLDPYRITVASQLARLHAGRIAPAALDVSELRFDSGRRGYRAALALQDDPAMRADPDALASLRRTIARQQQFAWTTPPVGRQVEVDSVSALRNQLAVAPGAVAPADDWYRALLASRPPARRCALRGADCVVLTPDLRRDGEHEILLCDLGSERLVGCQLFTHEGKNDWRLAGSFSLAADDREGGLAMRRQLRAGKLGIAWPRWPEIRVGGVTGRFRPATHDPAPTASAPAPGFTND